MKNKGFTLIEILVVVAIVSLLSSVIFSNLRSARLKARDAKRLSDMRQIQTALDLYHSDYGGYPEQNSSNGSWEHSTEDEGDFIDFLLDFGYMPVVPVDPINSGTKFYSYFLYPSGSYSCAVSLGNFYILGVRDMESSGIPHPLSPGWNCPGRNWQNEFDWVIGKFEK